MEFLGQDGYHKCVHTAELEWLADMKGSMTQIHSLHWNEVNATIWVRACLYKYTQKHLQLKG